MCEFVCSTLVDIDGQRMAKYFCPALPKDKRVYLDSANEISCPPQAVVCKAVMRRISAERNNELYLHRGQSHPTGPSINGVAMRKHSSRSVVRRKE